MSELIRVLVVDDSAFVRKVVTQMLTRDRSIQVVAAARDGEEGLELAEQYCPDVIMLDLMMPRMNGVEFLREQAKRRPIPAIVCSVAHESGELALDALEAGAVDFVQKPTALATDRVYEMAAELVAKVRVAASAGAARSRIARLAGRAAAMSASSVPDMTTAAAVAAPARTARVVPTPDATAVDLIVLGISTGGPHALRQLVPQLAADFPVPIAIVLHMPVGYTALYAERLNAISALEVIEAYEGAVLRPGVVWLAPGGQHLTFVRGADAVRAHLDMHPVGMQHRPAVDVLFRSAADVFGSRVLGVVMTGMGNDGLSGAARIKEQGGRIVTEAASSCVVYGMPRAVVDASLSDRSATLDMMADVIAGMV